MLRIHKGSERNTIMLECAPHPQSTEAVLEVGRDAGHCQQKRALPVLPHSHSCLLPPFPSQTSAPLGPIQSVFNCYVRRVKA